MTIAPGSRLGQYEIVSLIGAGGMGEDYKAQDTRLKRLVALKLLPPELTRDETAKQRFLQEATGALPRSVLRGRVVSQFEVVQRRGRLGLLEEAALRGLVAGQIGRQELDCDAPIESWVMRRVDDAHAALPQLGHDGIRATLGAGGQRHTRAGL